MKSKSIVAIPNEIEIAVAPVLLFKPKRIVGQQMEAVMGRKKRSG